MTAILGLFCALFALLSLYLYRWGISQRKKPQPTVDASQMLRDLFGSGATLYVKVLDTDALLIRSPRSGGWQ